VNKLKNHHQLRDFQNFIWDFYHKNGRSFAWRNNENPYAVVVSEIMLQQTQTHRVIEKYEEFMFAFPTFKDLAAALLRDVVVAWKGLGYYRRARYLHQIAQIIMIEYKGILPQEPHKLEKLPGIGAATAGSIAAFAFNIPTVFIETNIRAVFIHHFFPEKQLVSDKEIMPLVAAVIDQQNPREWYYALMDYGVWLKSTHKNPSRKSSHYHKQSKFEGSDRQIRAQILKLIADKGNVTDAEIMCSVQKENTRIEKIIAQLLNEQFITKNNSGKYAITNN
jgi:A/G-specific adenine glycosylase